MPSGANALFQSLDLLQKSSECRTLTIPSDTVGTHGNASSLRTNGILNQDALPCYSVDYSVDGKFNCRMGSSNCDIRWDGAFTLNLDFCKRSIENSSKDRSIGRGR